MDLKNKHVRGLLGAIKIFLIVCTVAVSCDDCGCGPEYQEVGIDKAAIFGEERMIVNGPTDKDGKLQQLKMTVVKWRYEGHHYIYFYTLYKGTLKGQGVIHDPKCPTCIEAHTSPTTSEYESIFGTW